MSRLAFLPLAVAAVGTFAAPAAAQVATVATFAEYASATTRDHQATIGRPVSSGGFDFYAASGFQSTNRNALGTWGTDDPDAAMNRPVNLGGSVAMFGTQFGERIDMVAGGQDLFAPTYKTFSIFSIDLAHQFAQSYLVGGTLQPFSVTFYGFLAGGDQINQTFQVGAPAGGLPTLTTYAFDERWNDLEQVTWFQSSLGSPFGHQFTNVTAYTAPEPGTYALLATGLAALGGIVVRRRRAS